MKITRNSLVGLCLLIACGITTAPRCGAAEPSTMPAVATKPGAPTSVTQILAKSVKAVKKPPGLTQNMLISQVAGRMSRKPIGGYYRFVLVNPGAGWPKSVRILPNVALTTLQAEDKPDTHARKGKLFLISGVVTLYDGKPYVLISPNIQLLARRPGKSTPKPVGKTINRVGASGQSPAEILAGLLKHHIARPLQAPRPAKGRLVVRSQLASPEFTVDQKWRPRPEGSYLWNRRARLLHNPAQHEWFLALESNGTQRYSPTIGVMPGPLLEKMRTIAARQGTRVAFRISGRVTEYHDLNYIFLTYIQEFHFLGRD